MARIRYGSLPTERSNPRSARLDRLSVTAIARLMNRVDQDAVRAAGRAGLAEARRRGALTVLVTCNPSVARSAARIVIPLRVGPEVLAGSTRLKAGTATKLTLNTLTTATFARLGKVHGNRMVDLQPRSAKLLARAIRLVSDLGDVGPARAASLLGEAAGRAKVAIVMARQNVSAAQARRRLREAGGLLGRAAGI